MAKKSNDDPLKKVRLQHKIVDLRPYDFAYK
jgi:hypothetical protein